MTPFRSRTANCHIYCSFAITCFALCAGCGSKAPIYVEPDLPDSELAVVQGNVVVIDGMVVKYKTLREPEKIRVVPGDHQFGLYNTGDKFSFPGPNVGRTIPSGPSYSRLRLRLKAGHEYSINGEAKTFGDRVRIENLSTDRIVYFDAQRLLFYDAKDNILHHNFNQPFEP